MPFDRIPKNFIRIIALTVPVFALACSDSDDGAKETPVADNGIEEEASTPECVLGSDGSCPDGCQDLTGWPWNEDEKCWLESVVIGCAPLGSAFDDAMGCYVNIESDTLYKTPALFYSLEESSFRECSSEEKSAIFAADDACE